MKNENDDNSVDFGEILIAGPIVLDSRNNLVYTFLGGFIKLSSNDFKTLWHLAGREGIKQSFKKIYKVVWNNGDGIDRRDEARKAITDIIERLDTGGRGFVWIDHTPASKYTFRTKWSHNQENWEKLIS